MAKPARGRDADVHARAVMTSRRRIVRMLRLADRGVAMAHGLSAAQLFVLHSLAAAPASSVAELAARTFTDQSSVSTVVSRLVDGRMVTRTAAATDRRRVELALTAAGRAAVRGAPQLPQTKIIAAIRAMPAARQRDIARALVALSTAIGADAVDARMLFEDEPAPRSKRARRR
jgi:DNA-binding MarR family transcriptional regulator